MENKKSSKGLLVGIIGAVVVLAVVLVLLLTQCTGGQAPATTATTAAQQEAESYTLYWNLDRAEYDGKSEAGMSSRMPESDGYFHVRLQCDGEVVTLKTADRKIINKLDTMSLFGLELDDQGMIVEVLDVDDLPVDTSGWGFYVQSVGGKVIKLNSSESLSGMELLLEADEDTGIYDMTGMSGLVGCKAEPIIYDRVYPIKDQEGKLTHLFLYDRSQFMLTHEGDCEHCGEKVTWFEWTNTDSFPLKSGHYQIMNDIQLNTQFSFSNDTKMCVDLNGKTIHGKQDTRLISLHNPGCEFALMDTSEGKTGRMVGHSTASPQGGVVWVRYGQFHLYSGTLDGSDMVSRLNGTVVQVPKAAFFYMYGGEIIGGTAAPQYNASTGKYTYGLGGSVQIAGTMRMYGGTIRDGKAPAAYYYSKGKLTLARGMGGNIFLSSGGVLEISGGEIRDGFAGNVGANIMMDGTAELIMKGGTISGGRLEGRIAGKNGANIYCPAKSKIEMTGGSIVGGKAVNGGGGNIYLCGKMTMTNASILGGYAGQRGGNILMSSTGSLRMDRGAVIGDGVSDGTAAGHGGGNICMASDKAELLMVGGTIRDGYAKGKVGEDGVLVGGDGGNININRGFVALRGGYVVEGKAGGNAGGIYVGWNSKGLQLDQGIQIYDNEGLDIVRSNNTASGKSQLLLGTWRGNPESVGAPVVARLSGVAGSLVVSPAKGKTIEETDLAKFAGNSKVLPLTLKDNGTIVYGKPDLGEPDHLHCLCAGKYAGHTCTDTGFVSVDAEMFEQCWSVGTSASSLMGSLNMCLTEDITISTEYAVSGNTLNLCLHGHTITMEGDARLTANGTTGVLNITDCTGSGKIVAAEGCRASFVYSYKGEIDLYNGTVDAANLGVGYGALRVGYADDVINMYGGTVIGSKNATAGGSVNISAAGTFNLYGGTIRDGVASSTGGGNIYLGHDGAAVNIYGGTISGGKATATTTNNGLGGNIHVFRGSVNISGGTITGGSSKDNSGGVYMAYNAGALTLSGNAKLYGNKGADIWLTSKDSYTLTLGNWAGNGSRGPAVIGKTNGTVGSVLVSGAVDKSDLELFASAHDGLVLKVLGGKIALATPFVHEHCLCADTLEHTCEKLSFVEVESKASFETLFDESKQLKSSVSIVLTNGFTLDAEYKTAGQTLDICLNGQTITMSGNGRITANGGGELNITDCTGSGKILAAEGCRHSFLYTYTGRLNLYAGTIDGSAIVLDKGTTSNSGGVVNVYNAGDTFNMYGGQIIGATIYRGGAIYVYKGAFQLHGGKISGGNARIGGNIAVDFGEITLSGGEITGGTAETNGAGVYLGYNMTTRATLADDARIYGNTGANDIYAGQKAVANRVLVLDGWKGNGASGAMVVGCSGAAEGTVIAAAKEGKLTDNAVSMLASGHEGLSLALDAEGKIVLEETVYHKHCICNGMLTGTEDHTCEVLTFVEVANTDAFLALFGEDRKLKDSVAVYLTGNVELSAEYWTDGKTLSICLNGHTIDLKAGGRLTANADTGVLNITDCGSGEIKGTTNSFLFGYKGDINLYGGTVNASAISLSISSGKYGGAVYMGESGDTFTMYGGTILGGQLERGGAVFAQKGSVIIRDGLITGGKAKLGGGVGVNFGTFEMTGGEITGNNATTNGAGVFLGYNMTTKGVLGGDAAIYGNTGCEDIRLGQKSNDHKRLVLDGWTGCGAGKAMTVSTGNEAEGSVIAEAKTGAVTGAQLAFLAYCNRDYTLTLNGEGKVALKKPHLHCVCNGKITGEAFHTCEKLTWTEVNAAQFLALFGTDKKLTASHTVVLTEDVTLDAEYTLNGNTLNLCLGGKTITMTGNGRITANGVSGVLNLTDCGEGKIVAAEGARASFLYVYKGVMNIYGGTVDATKSAAGDGGAIKVGYAGDVLNIYGGTVIGSRNATAGGSIYMAVNGKVTMYGGTVKDGKSTGGGGNLRVEAGETHIKGGTISGGTAACGGNIHVYKTAMLYVEGGTITGGVSNGTTGGYGGGNIYLGDGPATVGAVNISGGTISGGTSTLEGGNININRGAMVVTGGTITGGASNASGGGIYVAWNCVNVTVSGNALIYGNTDTDIVRCANTSTSKGRLLLGEWAGNGEHGAAKLDTLFTGTGKTVIAAAEGYTLTEADLAKFNCVGTYGLALSGGKFITSAK